MSQLKLKNPHSVLAALQQRSRDVLEVRIPRRASAAWQSVGELAARQGIPVGEAAPPPKHSAKGNRSAKSGREGGGEATVRERAACDIRDLLQQAPADQDRALYLALDQIQDPHNVGAIFRTAAFFGVRGIILTRHKSAPLTNVAYDVASGGVEYVPHACVTNLQQSIELAKQRNLWVLGSSEHAETRLDQVDRMRSWLVIVGNEESGLRRLTQACCDEVCRIPGGGSVGSLNVSVATGVLLSALCDKS